VKVDNDPPGAVAQAGHPIQMTGDGSSRISHYPFTDSNVYEGFGTTARKATGNPTASLSSAFRCYNVRSAAGAYSTHVDGTTHFSTATNTVGFGGFGRFIGHANGSTDARWFDGDLALVAICPEVLDSTDRDTMRAYITAEYGITF